MAEHLLDDLDVRAAGDREAGRGVPQLMRVQIEDSDRPSRGAERGPEGADPEWLAVPDAGEHQIVGLLADDVRGELRTEEPWDRHLAALVGLGGAPDEPMAVDWRH